MRIGVPTEIKPDEYRVAITPAGVRELSAHGHAVLVQAGAGEGSAFADADFEQQGARIVPHAHDIFEAAELVLKVKEPQPVEVEMLHEGQTLFTSRSGYCVRTLAASTKVAGISAPVGQACTHSPQATQVEAPIGSSKSNTIFSP